jgi:hypothetical protein
MGVRLFPAVHGHIADSVRAAMAAPGLSFSRSGDRPQTVVPRAGLPGVTGVQRLSRFPDNEEAASGAQGFIARERRPRRDIGTPEAAVTPAALPCPAVPQAETLGPRAARPAGDGPAAVLWQTSRRRSDQAPRWPQTLRGSCRRGDRPHTPTIDSPGIRGRHAGVSIHPPPT